MPVVMPSEGREGSKSILRYLKGRKKDLHFAGLIRNIKALRLSPIFLAELELLSI